MATYAAIEIGLPIYDAYDIFSTVTDDSVSTTEKIILGGLFVVGMVASGGGYSEIDDVAKGAVRNSKIRNVHLAGNKHPVTGIPFYKNGFLVFSSMKKANDIRIADQECHRTG